MSNSEKFLYTNDENLPLLISRLIGANREATYWDLNVFGMPIMRILFTILFVLQITLKDILQ